MQEVAYPVLTSLVFFPLLAAFGLFFSGAITPYGFTLWLCQS